MSKVFLINVGANDGHKKLARSPIFRDGTFSFVTYPDSNCPSPYPKSVRDFVSDSVRFTTHLDPDLTNMTYGDSCANGRARALLSADAGDILLFWGLFWRMANGEPTVFDCRDRGWYILAAIRIKEILEAGDRIDKLTLEEKRRVRHNAHMDGERVNKREFERVFVGDLAHSALFDRAVDLEVYKDGGLMQQITRTADGRMISWHKSPRWNSVTRACRAILDLTDRDDITTARELEQRIQHGNPRFKLLAGLG